MYCISQGTDISGHQGEQLGNGDAMVWSQRERLLTLAATDSKLGCRASLANELGSRGRHVVSAASGHGSSVAVVETLLSSIALWVVCLPVEFAPG